MNFEDQDLDNMMIPYLELDINCNEINISKIDDNIIKRICQLCGICWETRNIQVPASKMTGKLDSNQIISLNVFQNNIIHFFEHFDNFIKICCSNYSMGDSPLFSGIANNFEKRAVRIFLEMTRNFADQLLQKSYHPKEVVSESDKGSELICGGTSGDGLIQELCSGDLEKTLKLVPSRELARQLGISDTRLRREIYVARQRALKKRPISKIDSRKREKKSKKINSKLSNNNYSEIDDEKEEELSDDFEDYFDMAVAVTTCASPPSSTQTNNSSTISDEVSVFEDAEYDNVDEDYVNEEDYQFINMDIEIDSSIQTDEEIKEVEVVDEVDGWLNVESWLKSDIFEA